MSCIDGALIRNLHTVPVNAGDVWRAYEEGAWTTTNKLWCFRFDEPENVALYGGTSCTGWYVETGSSGETRPCIVGADGCTKGEITPLCSEPSPPPPSPSLPPPSPPAPPLAPSPPCYDAFEVRVGVKLLMPIGGVGGWHVPAESCAHFEAAPTDCGVWTWTDADHAEACCVCGGGADGPAAVAAGRAAAGRAAAARSAAVAAAERAAEPTAAAAAHAATAVATAAAAARAAAAAVPAARRRSADPGDGGGGARDRERRRLRLRGLRLALARYVAEQSGQEISVTKSRCRSSTSTQRPPTRRSMW